LRIINPAQQKPTVSRNLRKERRRWDNAAEQPLALGCVGCTERSPCGGQHKKLQHYSCLDDCCGKPDTCDSVCPRNLRGFIDRVREIDGFDLENIPRAKPCAAFMLPTTVPLLYHKNRRETPCRAPIVALPLHRFYSRKTGMLRFQNREEIENEFCLARGTNFLLIGSGRDRPLEGWWALSDKRKMLLECLGRLGPVAMTSPNFSLFTDEVRYNDLYNIKRIGITWGEAVAAGIPCALHLNARTERDYERLAHFIDQRPEVTEVSFEFGTGAGWPLRRDFHIEQLVKVARFVRHPLHLVMIGGTTSIPALAPAYAGLTFVDTSSFMNALHRQRLYMTNAQQVKKRSERTRKNAPVDALLTSNIEVMKARIQGLISESRAMASLGDSSPTQEDLESALFELTEPV
jgi:hypothetical protein